MPLPTKSKTITKKKKQTVSFSGEGRERARHLTAHNPETHTGEVASSIRGPPSYVGPIPKQLRYADLVERGFFRNRQTLKNWIKNLGFPPGRMISPNLRTWNEDEVLTWLASRPATTKQMPKPKPPYGRARKKIKHHAEAAVPAE